MKKSIILRHFILLIGILTLFIAAKPIDEKPNPSILRTLGAMLEQGHYSPRKIDDALSKEIFNEFIKRLDPNKRIFLQKDLNKLRKYESSIDDEIHGSPFVFFDEANNIFKQRLNESEEIYKNLIEKPFEFTKNEVLETDSDKFDFAGSDNIRKERWRKYIKWMTLERFIELQEQQDKNKSKSDFVAKDNETLEKEARAKVKKSMDKYFERMQVKFDDNERFSMLVNVITNLMDPHTDFFPPVEKRSFDERLSGRFFGIGALLQQDDEKIKIKSVTVGGPAWKSGEIQENDLIVKVAQATGEAEDITGYTTTEAVKLIRGAEGTEVKITVQKPDGTLKTVSLIRSELKLDETFARSVIIEHKGHKFGLIDLPSFYVDFQRPQAARCSQDVANEIKKLKETGVEGIVIDVRDNGGGSLQEVVNMVGLFIKTGPIVQIKDKLGRSYQMSDNDQSVLYDGPLAVMVNERSASASEIFASAIQDYKRGIIIGSSSTYGKGTVQRAFPIGDKESRSGAGELGSIHLTIQKYYRINGGSTQLKGVEPDIVLTGLYEAYKIREKDAQAALPWDEMTKASYQTWNNNLDFDALIQKSKNRITTDSTFRLIKEKTELLAENAKANRALNIEEYKNQTKQIKDISAKVKELTQLKSELNIQNLTNDLSSINADNLKKERNDFWLKYLKKDIYLNETLEVFNDWINNKAIANKN